MNPDVLWRYLPSLISGFGVTIFCWSAGGALGMLLGFAIALARRLPLPPLRWALRLFIEVFRGTPFLMQLFLLYSGGPYIGLRLNATEAGVLGLGLYSSAYFAEIFRAGFASVPRGQIEAASAIGLSWWKTTAFIVMPQALRHVIPGIVNSFISLFKDTSLVSIVSLFDLLGQVHASFADPVWATPTTLFTGFAFAGMIYFTFCFGMSRYSLFVENRLNAHRK
jgi:general L-amino acid transport system permease protein